MEIGEPCRLGAQAIHVRRAQYWIAVRRQVAVTLVVRDQQDDVVSLGGLNMLGEQQTDPYAKQAA